MLAGDDLHQAVLRSVVEVVQAHEALGTAHRCGQFRHGEGRGVGGQYRVGTDDAIERAEERGLGLAVLEDGLHHQVADGQVLQIGGAGDAAQHRFHRAGGEHLALHALLQHRPDAFHALVDEPLFTVRQQHGGTLLGELLRDGSTHGACTHHPYCSDLHHAFW